jgi:TonB-linked SusC/RagA family outer membrane protein
MKRFHIYLLIFALQVFATGVAYSSDSEPMNSPPATELSESLQQNRVTGRVSDAVTGEPLLGVTVVVKGTTIGQITDPMGNYSINIPQQEVVLVFSSVGYASQEVAASAGAVINIAMTLDVLEMEEVVVVGYGIQKKESVVGSISQATGDQILNSVKGADLTNSLAGNLPGLITVQNSGIPGGSGAENPETQLYIRGAKSWNSSQPLILVDGIEREMNDVDPYTVESVSVLKDASATAVFGVKGANGVILITTRRGQVGRPKLSLNVSTTGKTVSRLPATLDSYTALKLRNWGILSELPVSENSWGFMTPEPVLGYYRDRTYPDYLPNVQWRDEMLKDYTFDRNVNLNISGGTKFVKYFGSLSYLNEGDILKIQDYGQGYSPNFEYNRFNFRSNLDFTVTPTTTFSVNLAGFFGAQKRPRQGLSNVIWFGLYAYPPDLIPLRYSDGTWAEYPLNTNYQNQMVDANFTGYALNKETQVNSDFQLVQKLDAITKGLSIKGKVSYDILAATTGPNVIDNNVLTKYISKDIINEIQPGITEAELKEIENRYTTWVFPSSPSSGYDYYSQPFTYSNETAFTDANVDRFYRSLNYELSLNYNRDFGKHTVGGLVLMSRNERARGSVFPSYREDWVGRVVYGYDSRYLLEFNGAYNGSEKFDAKYRFGFFPSVAAGWVISNEQFFAPITPVVNSLKVRVSNGKVGSDAGIGRWQYTGSYDVQNTTWYFGAPFIQNTNYPWRLEGVIPNPAIQWETSEKTGIGVETGFFDNMITINFDYFWEDRTNIFVSGAQRVIPVYFGAPAVAGNFGRVKNEGWEIEADFTKRTTGGLRISAGLAVAFAKDIVIEKADPELRPAYQKEAGYPIGQPRWYINTDIADSWNDVYLGTTRQTKTFFLPGDYRLLDFNGDGVISPDDQAPYGYANRPQYTYAPKFGIDYKGFSLNVMFYGAFNTEQFQFSGMGEFGQGTTTLFPHHLERVWSPELGRNAEEASWSGLRYLTESTPRIYGYNSRAYLRLKTAVLSYNLNSSFVNKLGLGGVRFTINGDNLFLWSDMVRDIENNDADETRLYPNLKRLTFGVNVNF